MKKILTLVTVSVMACLCCTGCGSHLLTTKSVTYDPSNQDAKQHVVITDDFTDEVVDDYYIVREN